jgi:spermidine/putrescine transport system ATP-binding protein
VADFIGDTNFLDGKVAEGDGSKVQITLDGGGSIWAVAPQPVTRGSRVSVTVRPEKMHIRRSAGEDARPPQTNAVQGHVTSIVYIGTDTHYGVTLPSGQELRVREQNASPESRFLAKEGEGATVYFTPEAARVLTE